MYNVAKIKAKREEVRLQNAPRQIPPVAKYSKSKAPVVKGGLKGGMK